MTDFRPIHNAQPPDQHEREIFNLVVVQGHFPEEVAIQFNIDHDQIERIVYQTTLWLAMENMTLDPNVVRSNHFRSLEYQFRSLMQAWRHSCKEDVVSKVIRDGDRAIQKIEQTRREQSGDVRYLEHARRIMAEMRTLCGIENAVIPQEESEDDMGISGESIEKSLAEIDCRIAALLRRAGLAKNAETAKRDP